jgi:hypothetical protein
VSLVAFDGTPLVIVGGALRNGAPSLANASSATMDAANEAAILYGRIVTSDGGSHTIDTTGSSALSWRTGSVTFANAGTTFKVGLAPLDAGVGPPARASNASDVISFDVSRSLTGGGGGITANAWQTHVPDSGSKVVANGDFLAFCVQMTARGGVDSISMSNSPTIALGCVSPGVTTFTGGAYADNSRLPNAIITFSDGAFGYFLGGFLFTTTHNLQTWNSSSAQKEYGNYFRMPVPAKIYGIVASLQVTENTDIILYSDPLGTPVAEKTVSLDVNAVGTAQVNTWCCLPFASPYITTASQPVAGIMKPLSTTDIIANYLQLNDAAHQAAHPLGTNCYAISRATGSFAAQNASKDRYALGLLVAAFDDGAGAGGGMIRHPGMNGGMNA